jgi:hypothetical protein
MARKIRILSYLLAVTAHHLREALAVASSRRSVLELGGADEQPASERRVGVETHPAHAQRGQQRRLGLPRQRVVVPCLN